MILLKQFPIEQTDEANAFMKEHPPRSTDKQSGVVFHNGHTIVVYEDGAENPEQRTTTIIGEREADRQKLLLVEHSLEQAKAALVDEKAALETLAPKGYEIGMSDTKLRTLFTEYTPAETIADFRRDAEPIENRISNLDNEILLDTHEMKRLSLSIKAWDTMLK